MLSADSLTPLLLILLDKGLACSSTFFFFFTTFFLLKNTAFQSNMLAQLLCTGHGPHAEMWVL